MILQSSCPCATYAQHVPIICRKIMTSVRLRFIPSQHNVMNMIAFATPTSVQSKKSKVFSFCSSSVVLFSRELNDFSFIRCQSPHGLPFNFKSAKKFHHRLITNLPSDQSFELNCTLIDGASCCPYDLVEFLLEFGDLGHNFFNLDDVFPRCQGLRMV
mmetsp:Transcript_62866/g.86410  ORF Transcript_62866/g.86410 Transcript_62866/m.86410 type:complete len:158 (+) Transcript_62866:185-658(+)